MSSSRKPSPARSQGAPLTPRCKNPRKSRSVGSPALSNASGRLSSIIQEYMNENKNSFVLSPLMRRSMLTDNTDIEEPRRKSWWKKLDENSIDVLEVLEGNKAMEPNNIIEELDIEVLSQEKKNCTLDLPESSDGESINSIVLPQRKLFTEKENLSQKKFGQFGTRDTLGKLYKTNASDNTVSTATKELFQNKPRSKPIFPAALLNVSPNKTTDDKTLTVVEPKGQVRNIFGNRQSTKRKNLFTNFIVSESEDEIPEIQPKVFGFQKSYETKRRPSSSSHGLKATSPTSSITTDMELDDWKLLPSSTMVETQLEAIIAGGQTPKRARLSKLSEAKESDAGTNSTETMNKTKQSNKSTSFKNKSKTNTKEKILELNSSVTTRNRSKESRDREIQLNKSQGEKNKSQSTSPGNNDNNISQSSILTRNRKKSGVVDTKQNTSINKSRTNSSRIKNTSKISLQQTENDDEIPVIKNHKAMSENVSKNLSFSQNQHVGHLEEQHSVNVSNDLESVVQNDDDELNFTLEYENDDIADEIDVAKEATQENNSIINKSNKKTTLINTSLQKTLTNKVVEEPAEITNQEDKTNDRSIKENSIHSQNESIHEGIADNCHHEEVENEIQHKDNENVEQEDEQKSQESQNQTKELENDSESREHSQEIEHENYEAENDDNSEEEEQNKTLEIENEVKNESQENQIESQEIEHESDDEIDNDDNNEDVEQNKILEVENENQEEQMESQEIEHESDEEAENDDNTEDEEQNKILEVENEEMNESQEKQNEYQEELNESHEMQDETHEEHNESGEVQNESNEQENEDEYNESHEIENESENEQQNVSQEGIDQNESDEDGQEMESDAANESIDEEIPAESDQDDNQEAESDRIENQNENNQTENTEGIDTSTPNVSHDTTGRNRKKNESPEVILHDRTNQAESFAVRGRNTSVRKTKSIINNQNIRSSFAPPVMDSIGFSDGTKNSSAEGSGWDSHRTTRKTLRQTFGKDFTPRKSLRTLVMEKSAKRTMVNDISSVTAKFPQANSTELPEESAHHDDYVEMSNEPQESDHEISRRTRQTTLEMYLQKIKEQNMENRGKMEEAVRNSLKAPPRDMLNPFKIPARPMFPRRTINKTKCKAKPIKSFIPLEDLPEEVIQDMKYKPPKRFQPSNAPWITKRLYKYLETKLEPKYDYKARVRSEKLVESLYHFAKELRRHDVASTDAVDVLKHEMARLDVVKTHFEFYEFFHEFMPREIRIKVIPDVVNKIPVPRHGVFSDILRGNAV